MKRALVIYATRTGETKGIAQLISEGMRFSGMEVEMADAGDFKKPEELEGFDAYALGSPTYHGDMLPAMKTLLFLLEKADLKGKAGGSFGSYGWSGEANERIFGTMKNVFDMDMVSGPLMLKSASLGGGVQMAQGYGKEIAKKLESG